MLKLMPILEHMDACDESKDWIRKKNFATFAQAFSACPNGKWLDWLCDQLARGNNDASAASLLPRGDSAALIKHYAPHGADFERWLVEYAHKHGCAVEVVAMGGAL